MGNHLRDQPGLLLTEFPQSLKLSKELRQLLALARCTLVGILRLRLVPTLRTVNRLGQLLIWHLLEVLRQSVVLKPSVTFHHLLSRVRSL